MEKITLESSGEKYEGILIKEDKEFLTVKLKSGYNMNLRKKDSKILKKEKTEDKKNNLSKVEKNPKLPKITILHTGGTIASKVDYKLGGVISNFTPEELLQLYPELNEIANIDAKMIASMWSGDMRFDHYNLMLDEISKAIKEGTEGIILSHGTDTIGYSAAALQYSLKNLPVPVIIVAAQRSADRPSSDGFLNLKNAVNFILNSKGKFNRVGLCMHSGSSDDEFNILDGINLVKTHTSRRDTFKQINYPVVCEIKNDKLNFLRKFKIQKGDFSYSKYDIKLKIGVFKTHPALYSKEIENLSFYDGVVIEGTGLGHMNVHHMDDFTKENANNLKALEKLQKSTKVVMNSQCLWGAVNMNVYNYGLDIQKTGVLGQHMNLTTESLFSRLAYCLSNSKNDKEFNELWQSNLEGFDIRSVEITED